MASSGYLIVGIFLIIIIYCVAIPTILWFGYEYRKRERARGDEDSTVFFNRRNPVSIYVMLGFAVATLAIERPLNILQTLMEVFAMHPVFQLALYTAFYFGFIYIFILRTFILLWNFKYSQATARLIWKKVLNPEFDELDNVYLRYNHILGSFNNSGPCSILIWILAVMFLPTFVMITDLSFALGSILTLLLPCLFALWLAFKISKVTDMYMLRKELMNGIIVIAVTLCIYLVLYLAVWVPTQDDKIEVILFTLTQIISTLVLCFFSTVWVIRALDKIQRRKRVEKAGSLSQRKKKKQKSQGDEDDSDDSSDTNDSVNSEDRKAREEVERDNKKRKEAKPKTLRQLVKDRDGFNIFMEHLVKELSIENLLFLTEYIQFKQNLYNEQWIPKIIGWTEEIPPSLPKCETLVQYPTSDPNSDDNIHKTQSTLLEVDDGNDDDYDSGKRNKKEKKQKIVVDLTEEDEDGRDNSNDAENDDEMKDEVYVTPQGPPDDEDDKHDDDEEYDEDNGSGRRGPQKVEKHKIVSNRHKKRAKKQKEVAAREREFQLNVSFQLKFLYDKYVFESSDLALNISSSLRKKYMKRFDKKKHGDDVEYKIFKLGSKRWCVFYDQAAMEIWKLMKDSFVRFQSTEVFDKWSILIDEKDAKAEEQARKKKEKEADSVLVKKKKKRRRNKSDDSDSEDANAKRPKEDNFAE